MGYRIGPTFKGVYQLVPPPGANVTGFGLKRVKRGLRKAGKGAVKLHTAPLKANYRVTKKAHKMTTKIVKKMPGGKLALKIANAPLSVGKYALKAFAKLAAKPLTLLFRKLARRRANYLAYQRSGTTNRNAADNKAGIVYAEKKFKSAGPLGILAVKIIHAVGEAKFSGVGLDQMSDGWRQEASACGMTGAEIAAAVAAILGALTGLVKSLNKKGEAPANPAEGGPPKDAEDGQDVVKSESQAEETPAEAPAEEAPAEDATEGESYDGVFFDGLRRKSKKARRY
jgi:hypothetical protein